MSETYNTGVLYDQPCPLGCLGLPVIHHAKAGPGLTRGICSPQTGPFSTRFLRCQSCGYEEDINDGLAQTILPHP